MGPLDVLQVLGYPAPGAAVGRRPRTVGLSLEDISTDWNTFYGDVVAPAITLAATALVIWLILVIGARLFAMLPILRRVKMRRAVGRTLRIAGYVLAAAAAVLLVWFPSGDSPGVVRAVIVVAMAVSAVGGIVLLTFGMATRPRLDAVVLDAAGAENGSWRTELLVAMRSMNADDLRGRVERPSGSDLSEVIAVTGETKNWALEFSGTLASLLFNFTPWRLEVAVFDSRSGVVTLLRNGHLIAETPLRLPREPFDTEHPAELLTLAAAFAATNVADYYPDIVGFYGARGWEGIGWLQIALVAPEETRAADLDRAIHADPGSALAEYEDVYRHWGGASDIASLSDFIGRLEPMMRVAAARADVPIPTLQGVSLLEWHELPHGRGGEPRLLLLRLMASYTIAVRNWSMRAAEDGSRNGARPFRADPAAIIGAFIDLLGEHPERKYRALEQWFARMRQRAGLCFTLLDEDLLLADDEGGHDESEGLAAGTIENRRKRAKEWADEAKQSHEFEVRYSYACYLARRWHQNVPGTHHPTRIAAKLEPVCRQEEKYRRIAIHDPELRPLGQFDEMRRAVLGKFTAWNIGRFAQQKAALEALGVRHPQLLCDPSIAERLKTHSTISRDTAESLIDGAQILEAAEEIRLDGLDSRTRMRAVRHLLDNERHSVATLVAAHSRARQELVDDVAAAMFWVPRSSEVRIAEHFLDRLVERIRPLVILLID